MFDPWLAAITLLFHLLVILVFIQIDRKVNK